MRQDRAHQKSVDPQRPDEPRQRPLLRTAPLLFQHGREGDRGQPGIDGGYEYAALHADGRRKKRVLVREAKSLCHQCQGRRPAGGSEPSGLPGHWPAPPGEPGRTGNYKKHPRPAVRQGQPPPGVFRHQQPPQHHERRQGFLPLESRRYQAGKDCGAAGGACAGQLWKGTCQGRAGRELLRKRRGQLRGNVPADPRPGGGRAGRDDGDRLCRRRRPGTAGPAARGQSGGAGAAGVL